MHLSLLFSAGCQAQFCGRLWKAISGAFCRRRIGRSHCLFRETQPFCGQAIKRPIIAAVTGAENSSVFWQAVPRAGFSYVLAEMWASACERTKRPEIGGRIRTFFDSWSNPVVSTRGRLNGK